MQLSIKLCVTIHWGTYSRMHRRSALQAYAPKRCTAKILGAVPHDAYIFLLQRRLTKQIYT